MNRYDKKRGVVGSVFPGAESLSLNRRRREESSGGAVVPKMTTRDNDGNEAIIKSHGMYEKIIYEPKSVPENPLFIYKVVIREWVGIDWMSDKCYVDLITLLDGGAEKKRLYFSSDAGTNYWLWSRFSYNNLTQRVVGVATGDDGQYMEDIDPDTWTPLKRTRINTDLGAPQQVLVGNLGGVVGYTTTSGANIKIRNADHAQIWPTYEYCPTGSINALCLDGRVRNFVLYSDPPDPDPGGEGPKVITQWKQCIIKNNLALYQRVKYLNTEYHPPNSLPHMVGDVYANELLAFDSAGKYKFKIMDLPTGSIPARINYEEPEDVWNVIDLSIRVAAGASVAAVGDKIVVSWEGKREFTWSYGPSGGPVYYDPIFVCIQGGISVYSCLGEKLYQIAPNEQTTTGQVVGFNPTTVL